MNNFNHNTIETEYLNDYNIFLSNLSISLENKFAKTASPLLSKQETVTNFYNFIYKKSIPLNLYKIFIYNLILFPFRIMWHFLNLVYINRKFKIKSLPKNYVYFRTWLVPNSITNNSITDVYFGNLSNDLQAKETVILSYHPYKYTILWGKVNFINKNNIISIGILSFKDIIFCFLDYILNARNYQKKSIYYKNINLKKHINLFFLNEYFQMTPFLAFLEKRIAHKLLVNKIKAFIYVFENQSWEKVYCDIFSKNNITTIGYQSSGFSKIFLNFFPTKFDFLNQPQPNYILTVGDAFTKILNDNSNYKSKIITFAALRFNHPVINNLFEISAPNLNNLKKILYSFSVIESQHEYIIKKLIEVFSKTSITVHLKLHPLNQHFIKKYKNKLPKNFHFINKINNYSLKDNYDFTLFNDNSFGIESLIYGVKSYEFNIYGNNLDERLIYFNSWSNRIDIYELYKLKNKLENSNFDKNYDVNNITTYINFLYTPYNSNKMNKILNIIN